MISVNHSCGLLGVDCGNTPQADRAFYSRACARARTCMCAVILFSHKLALKVRSSWGGPTSALANRTCKSNLHGTSSYDSRPRLRRSGQTTESLGRISVPLVRVAYFRRATFRVFPLGFAAGLRRIRHHTRMHARARMQLP